MTPIKFLPYDNNKNDMRIKNDKILKQYIPLSDFKKEVLDIGFGNGRHTIWLAKQGFTVTALDKNKLVFDNLKNKISKLTFALKINLKNKDIKNFKIPINQYSAIVAFNSLNFMKKSEFLNIVDKIKKALKTDGIVFITLFTTKDPYFKAFEMRGNLVEKNTFLSRQDNSFWQFMDKNELKEIFCGFKTLLYEEKVIKENSPTIHKHGLVFYVGKRNF